MCLKKYEKNDRWRKKNKKLGLCPRCGKKAENGRVYCVSCGEKKRKLHKVYWNRRKCEAKDNGICWKCGNLYSGKTALCEICRDKWNKYQADRYAKINNNIIARFTSVQSNQFLTKSVYIEVEEEFLATSAFIGSKEKIDVMAERYDKGQPLFHPDDSKIWGKIAR